MSTRSSISVFKDKKYHTVYCHSNGYLQWNGFMLLNYYNDLEKASELVSMGGISSLSQSMKKPEGHSFGEDVDGLTVFYGRDRGEDIVLQVPDEEVDPEKLVYRYGAEFSYLFNDGKWFYKNYFSDPKQAEWRLLEEATIDTDMKSYWRMPSWMEKYKDNLDGFYSFSKTEEIEKRYNDRDNIDVKVISLRAQIDLLQSLHRCQAFL